MKIISFMEGEEVIKEILKHLGLSEVKAQLPPKVKAPSETIFVIQIPSLHLQTPSLRYDLRIAVQPMISNGNPRLPR